MVVDGRGASPAVVVGALAVLAILPAMVIVPWQAWRVQRSARRSEYPAAWRGLHVLAWVGAVVLVPAFVVIVDGWKSGPIYC